MKKLYTNATVYWNEQEIIEREALISVISNLVKSTWQEMNSAIKFYRAETPILTPESFLESHKDANFPMIESEFGFLRPEIAGGCFEVFFDMFPQEAQRMKQLPICIWQSGKSFRNEDNPQTMRASKLRLREFWQLEFELICAANTHAAYMQRGINKIQERFNLGELTESAELPHYSIKTIDWHINGLEVAGCSIRTDLGENLLVHEISIGLDRLMMQLLNREPQ